VLCYAIQNIWGAHQSSLLITLHISHSIFDSVTPKHGGDGAAAEQRRRIQLPTAETSSDLILTEPENFN
jgi:hypothetical protein